MSSNTVEMAGAREKELEVLVIKSVIIKSKTKTWRGNILLIPEISNSILKKKKKIGMGLYQKTGKSHRTSPPKRKRYVLIVHPNVYKDKECQDMP